MEEENCSVFVICDTRRTILVPRGLRARRAGGPVSRPMISRAFFRTGCCGNGE